MENCLRFVTKRKFSKVQGTRHKEVPRKKVQGRDKTRNNRAQVDLG